MLSQKLILLRKPANDISFGLFSSDNYSINNPEKEEFNLNDNHIDEENITKPNEIVEPELNHVNEENEIDFNYIPDKELSNIEE